MEGKRGRGRPRKYPGDTVEERRRQSKKAYLTTSKGKAAKALASRKYGLKSKYNMTPEEYDDLLNEQNGVCAICGEEESSGRWHGKERLAVDHCHKTGKVRALLCRGCNMSIGIFKESSELLKKAAEYLENHYAINKVYSENDRPSLAVGE